MVRSLTYATVNRKVKKRDFRELCEARIEAGAAEHSYNAWYLKESLHRCHIQLNTKVLANMAIWEPRTFRSVVAVAANKSMQQPQHGGLGLPHCGPATEVITRGKL
jgi:large subunit ribosomal protein L20